MIYNPENIRLREVDSHSGRRFKVSYYFRSLDVRKVGASSSQTTWKKQWN